MRRCLLRHPHPALPRKRERGKTVLAARSVLNSAIVIQMWVRQATRLFPRARKGRGIAYD